MRIEIDQSIKIEETNKNTIIGMANFRNEAFTVIIKGRTKRRLKEEFRKIGKPNLFKFRAFVAGVVLMIKYSGFKDISDVVIDEEYSGKEKILRSMFLEMWSGYFKKVPNFEIDNIGKKSNAHKISYYTMKGKHKPDKEISFDELRKLCL